MQYEVTGLEAAGKQKNTKKKNTNAGANADGARAAWHSGPGTWKK
jgi:hypothetical protein